LAASSTFGVNVYTDQFSDPFFSVGNGVLTVIPGVYEQFQPSSESDVILTITSDDPPVEHAGARVWPVAACRIPRLCHSPVFNREFKVRSL
jgi:hypothetical protein